MLTQFERLDTEQAHNITRDIEQSFDAVRRGVGEYIGKYVISFGMGPPRWREAGWRNKRGMDGMKRGKNEKVTVLVVIKCSYGKTTVDRRSAAAL